MACATAPPTTAPRAIEPAQAMFWKAPAQPWSTSSASARREMILAPGVNRAPRVTPVKASIAATTMTPSGVARTAIPRAPRKSAQRISLSTPRRSMKRPTRGFMIASAAAAMKKIRPMARAPAPSRPRSRGTSTSRIPKPRPATKTSHSATSEALSLSIVWGGRPLGSGVGLGILAAITATMRPAATVAPKAGGRP